MSRIRVMVVDDHEVVRSGLRAILEPEDDLDVVSEAATGSEATDKASRLRADVVLMDVRMEGMSGIEACRLIKSADPRPAVIMLTSFGEEEAVLSSIMAGASGYILKNVGRSDLLKAIRAAAAGQNLLDPAVTGEVMKKLAQLTAKEEERATENISDREKDVLSLVAQGLTNREIAERLVISENTARNHVSRILEKLGMTRRSELAAWVTRVGLVSDDQPG